MAEAGQIIILALILVAVYVLTRRANVWRARRAGNTLISELEKHQAYDPSTAVTLKDTQRDLLRTSLRTFRPEGLKILLASGVVSITHEGKYYLNTKHPSPGPSTPGQCIS